MIKFRFLFEILLTFISFIDIYDLADEQRAMIMAEQYSERRIMVRKNFWKSKK